MLVSRAVPGDESLPMEGGSCPVSPFRRQLAPKTRLAAYYEASHGWASPDSGPRNGSWGLQDMDA